MISCRDALQSNHRLYSARYLLSYVHFYRRQFGDAIENCARARTDNPNDAEVLLHEGQLEAFTGGAESGVRRVEEASASIRFTRTGFTTSTPSSPSKRSASKHPSSPRRDILSYNRGRSSGSRLPPANTRGCQRPLRSC